MAAYLSEAWLAEPVDPACEALAAAGGRGTIARVISGAPDGEARFVAEVGEGGVHYRSGAADDADLTLTDTYANAVAVLRGDLDPNAAFMRGQTKVAGDTKLLLDLLAATKTPPYQQARDAAAAAVG